MKNAIYILMLMSVLSSCNQHTKQAEDNPTMSGKDSIQNDHEKLIYEVTLKEKQYDLSMYNEHYSLRLIPDALPSKQNMKYQVFLSKNSETVINYPITIDTIASKYYEFDKTGLEDGKIEFKKEYYLSDLKHIFDRTDNLYLDATLHSKNDTTKMNVTLKFKYRGKEKGKLYVNVL